MAGRETATIALQARTQTTICGRDHSFPKHKMVNNNNNDDDEAHLIHIPFLNHKKTQKCQ